MLRSSVATFCLLLAAIAAQAVTVDESSFDRAPREDDLQQLVAPRLSAPPVIDGDLSDACWADAAVLKSFWLAGTTGTAEDQTIAWVGFDKDNLYVAYACVDKKVTGAGSFPRDDRHIWQNDGVEVHLSPTRDPGKFFQFIVGAGGSQFDRDCSLEKYPDQVAWNAQWQSAVKQQPFGYTVEIAIPLAAILDLKQYDVDRGTWWTVKLTRSDFGDHGGVRLSSWTRMGQHTSDHFSQGDLYFEDRNLIANGSAETLDTNGRPTGWESPANGVELTFTASTDSPTDGKQSSRVEIRGTPKGGNNSRIYPGQVARHRQPVETTYRFSADVRTESQPGALVAYFVVFNGNEIGQIKFDHNKPWKRVETLVTVEAGKTTHVPCIQAVPSSPEGVTQPGGFVFLDNVRFEPVAVADMAGDPDAMCLTGNAFGAHRTRNNRVNGTYTYNEEGVTTNRYPDHWVNQPPTEINLYTGPLRFDQGVLTDGQTSTAAQWGMFQTGYSNDVTFDMGDEFVITRVVVLGSRVGYGQVWLKSEGEQRYTLVASNMTLHQFNTRTAATASEQERVFETIHQPARWVRVQIIGRMNNPAEIQIWGKPVATKGETPRRKPVLQNEGKTPISDPQSRPIVYRDIPPVFPVPQEIKLEGNALKLRDGMTIAHMESDRARITAEVLAEEMQACFGVKLAITTGTTGDIVIGESNDAPDKTDGYLLTNDGKRVTIHGRNPRGTFYGTQTLLSLVRPAGNGAWQVPGGTVRDWPDMTVRYVQGRPIPDKNLVRALARFRVTHYEPQARYLAQAAQWDKEAQRYFVQFIPHLGFNEVVLSADENLTERPVDEDVKTMPRGRRNANPAHPKSWEIYEAAVAKWLPQFHGDFVHINYDETYQTSGGAFWNVSPESRALNLSAGDLIAWQINRIDKLFKQHGKSIAMHDTLFMGNHTLSYAGDPNPSWHTAMPKLPRDIKFLVWHPKDAGPLLHKAGFELYSLVLDERDWRQVELPGIYNGLTAYMAESSFTPAKLIDLIGVTWNLSAPRPNDPVAAMTTTRYIPLWRELHEGVRAPSQYAAPNDFTTLDISAAANRSRLDDVAFDGRGFVDLGGNCDMRALPAGTYELAGIPFKILDESANAGRSIVMIHNHGDFNQILPADVIIDVADLKAASLIFLHNLENRPGWNYLRRKELAGFYIIEYEDGSYGKHEIKYAVNTATWDGRPTNSGYSPKGHAMTDGFLAWEGDTTSGLPAFLYATEWTNPRPDKTITRIHLRSPKNWGNMNPMLYAVTAVNPRLASPQASPPEMPAMQLLADAQPTGTPYDLSGGKEESENRYVAPDGTVISSADIYNLLANHVRWDVIDYRSRVSMVNADGNYTTVRAWKVDYAFPKPTALTGALVTGGFRRERKTENFGQALFDYHIETSADGGKTWQTASTVKATSPEEHGPQWLAIGDAPVTNLRVAVKPLNVNSDGIQRVVLYRR